MRYLKSFIFLFLFIILFKIASATVSCDNSPVFLTYQIGEIPSGDITVTHCTNNGNETLITLSGDGVPTHITEGENMDVITIEKTLKIRINSNIPKGNYFPIISFGDGSSPVVLVIEIKEEDQSESGIIVFPTSKVISVQQETEKTQNILITVPENYPRTLTIHSVDFNPGTETIKFGDLNLGDIAPGQSLQIPIIFSGVGAQIGTYETGMSIFATDSEGRIDLPIVNLKLEVTRGLGPPGDDSLKRPACSLSASEMNLNSTYSFTCSDVVNNMEILPQYSDYLEGISVDPPGNLYTYIFKPVKFGKLNFFAIFSYRGAPLFAPFSQEVRITASGGAPGTNLGLFFTPSLETAKDGETVIIQLVDSKTNSLVENPQIEINAVPITNVSGKSFFYIFERNKNYSVRGVSPGYSDLVKDISLSTKPIAITISPTEGNTETEFTITTDSNATIFVNGESKGTEFTGKLSGGENIITASKEGYLDSKINLTVENVVSFLTSGEFKKGINQIIQLTKNETWTVSYQKDDNSEIEKLSEGEGDRIEFKPEKPGKYIIQTGDGSKKEFVIEGRNWSMKLLGFAWYWYVAVIGIIFIVYIYYKSGDSSSSSDGGVGGRYNLGGPPQ